MSCQRLILVCNLACAWYFLLGILLVDLSRVLFALGILPVDLGKLLRSRISLVFKVDGELPKVTFLCLLFFSSVYSLVYALYFLLDVLSVGLNRVPFVLGILPIDLGSQN